MKKRPPPSPKPLPPVEFKPVPMHDGSSDGTVMITRAAALCSGCGHGAAFHGNETGTQSGKGRCWMRINTENPPKDLHELIVGEACLCKEYR